MTKKSKLDRDVDRSLNWCVKNGHATVEINPSTGEPEYEVTESGRAYLADSTGGLIVDETTAKAYLEAARATTTKH
jgi:hypothetical protein